MITTSATTLESQSQQARVGSGEQHSLVRSVLLHLGPGVAITALYLLLTPAVMRAGYPPMVALLAAATAGVAGLELGHLLLEGRRRNARWSLRGVVLYREAMRLNTYLWLVPALVITAVIILLLTSGLDTWLANTLFSWLPAWYAYGDPAQYVQYGRTTILIVFGLRLVVDVLFFPVAEELYFRGYLLPRIDRFGRWAPILNHALFTVYHLWQPFNWPTIFLGIFPMVWATWRRRNYRIALATHMLLNLIGGILSMALVLSIMNG